MEVSSARRELIATTNNSKKKKRRNHNELSPRMVVILNVQWKEVEEFSLFFFGFDPISVYESLYGRHQRFISERTSDADLFSKTGRRSGASALYHQSDKIRPMLSAVENLGSGRVYPHPFPGTAVASLLGQLPLAAAGLPLLGPNMVDMSVAEFARPHPKQQRWVSTFSIHLYRRMWWCGSIFDEWRNVLGKI